MQGSPDVASFTKRFIVEWLNQEKVPLWLNILLIAAAALGTYKVAPHLNAKFEQQKIRSAFVIDALDNLNSQTSDLVVNVGAYNYCIATPALDCSEQVKAIQSSITKLQWRATELGTIIDDAAGKQVLLNFQKELDDIRIVAERAPSLANANVMIEETREFGRASIVLTDVIAKEAGISSTVRYDGRVRDEREPDTESS